MGDPERHGAAWESEAVLVAAEDRERLLELVRTLREELARPEPPRLRDIARGCGGAATRGGARIGIVADSEADLERKLAYAGDRLETRGCDQVRERTGVYYAAHGLAREGQLAFLFPGEGSQYPDMLADLCLHLGDVRAWFDLIDRGFVERGREPLPSRVIFRGADAGDDGLLWRMDCGTEAVFAADQALAAVLRRVGIKPDAVVGHSTGEYAALLASGAARIDGDDAFVARVLELNAIYERELEAGSVARGALLAVAGLTRTAVADAIAASGDPVYVAMENCPNQIVVCGAPDAVEHLTGELRRRGAMLIPLPFDRAYHTPLFARFSAAVRRFFDGAEIRSPDVPLYSAVTAARFPDDPDEIRALAASQYARPVRFRETVEVMHDAGIRLFVEVGPGGLLTRFVSDTLRSRPHVAVATNTRHRGGIGQLLHTFCELFAHGVDVDLEPIHAARACRRSTREPGAATAHSRSRTTRRLPLGLPLLEVAARPRRTPTPAAATSASTVKGALARHLDTMARFLETEEAVLLSYLSPAGNGRAGDASATRPAMIDGVLDGPADGRVTARCRLSAEGDRYLRDHALGRGISTRDPQLVGLVVVPLALSIELVAEAALLLEPGRTVVRVEQLRARRWITLEEGAVELDVQADRLPGTDAEPQVDVTVRAGGESVLSAVVVCADRRPEPPAATVAPPARADTCDWSAERIYSEVMFTGPAFQGVASFDRCGPDGAEATLLGLEPVRRASPALEVDPVTLDAAGQIVGCWAAARLERGFVIFPTALRRLEIYGPALAVGEAARCRARIAHAGESGLESDIEVVGGDGRARMRLLGWEDQRFALGRGPAQFVLAPSCRFLSEEWPAPLRLVPGAGDWVCRRLDAPSLLPGGQSDFWEVALAHLVLTPVERAAWSELRGGQRRREWLLGRIVAKDAVRLLLRERHGLALAAIDVEIRPGAHGRPLATGPWASPAVAPPTLSLSHAQGTAVALCGGREDADRVGIDIEPIPGRTPDLEHVAFTAEERAAAAVLQGAQAQEWALRLWSAKEAAGKALGRGLSRGARTFAVRAADVASGEATLVLDSALARDLDEAEGRELRVRTLVDDGLVVATSTVEGA